MEGFLFISLFVSSSLTTSVTFSKQKNVPHKIRTKFVSRIGRIRGQLLKKVQITNLAHSKEHSASVVHPVVEFGEGWSSQSEEDEDGDGYWK